MRRAFQRIAPPDAHQMFDHHRLIPRRGPHIGSGQTRRAGKRIQQVDHDDFQGRNGCHGGDVVVGGSKQH